MNRNLLLLLSSIALFIGCGDIPIDDRDGRVGKTPVVSGVWKGAITYMGPRPLCEYRDGKPVRFKGVALLSMFNFADPGPEDGGPPPFAALSMPVTEFFQNLRDCMPEHPTVQDLEEVITASAGFTWPAIPLGEGAERAEYRVSAVFDRDGDYIPFHLTHNIPTAGDVLGGAFVGFSNEPQKIVFGSECDHPNGQIVAGGTVQFALPLWTERLVFEVKQEDERGMSSEARIPTDAEIREELEIPGFSPPTSEQAYEALWRKAGLTLSLIDNERASLDCEDPENAKPTEKCFGPRLSTLGLDYDLLDQNAYAFHLRPLSYQDDGTPTLHPPLTNAFGPPSDFTRSVATPWTLPLVAITRIQSDEEEAAAIPGISFLGGVDFRTQREASVVFPDLPINVVPAASMDLPEPPGVESCDLTVYAPGHSRDVFQAGGMPTDCQELPVGDYLTVALTGVAGDMTYQPDPRSQTGTTIVKREGGFIEAQPVGQLWLHPNDLGSLEALRGEFDEDAPGASADDVLQVSRDVLLESQGLEFAFKVRDRNPDNEPRKPALPQDEFDQQVVSGLFTSDDNNCFQATAANPMLEGGARPNKILYPPVPCDCCPPQITQLCDVELCAPTDDGKREALKLAGEIDGEAQELTFENAEQAIRMGQSVSVSAIFVRQPEPELPSDASEASIAHARRLAERQADLVAQADDLPRPDPDAIRRDIDWEQFQRIASGNSSATDERSCKEQLEERRAAQRDDADGPLTPISELDGQKLVYFEWVSLTPTCLPFLMPIACCDNIDQCQ